MRTWVLGMACAFALAAFSADALAMCGGGGVGGGVGGGGSGMRVGGHGSRKPAEPSFKKWALPSPESAPSFDTSKWDAFKRGIDLTSEQSDKIAAARQKLQDELAGLAKAQDESRAAYQKCSCEASARAAAGKVAYAAQALKAFDPNARFASALANILSNEQMKQYREYVAKG
ncbi:MAG: hypothetical protein KIS92_15165 [Planctomycetota bacterium]|nr:hypothetical protein [Planctomycetota bacterium]